jgi:hypothetical protein
MKKLLVTLVAVVCAVAAFGQGSITFNNGVPNSIVAPIFGPQVGDPLASLSGAAAATAGAPAGFPAGTTVYTGAPLGTGNTGNNYWAQLWGGVAGTADSALQPLRSGAGADIVLNFRTVSGQLGLVRTVASAVVVPGVAAGEVARIQMRVWEARGGATWAEAIANADPTVLRGTSPSFNLTLSANPVNPTGLVSFNLYQVPEPSVIALGVLGVGALLLFRRRKN